MSMLLSVPYPSTFTANEKKWLICEWKCTPNTKSTIYDEGSFDTLIETIEYVKSELNRFYKQMGGNIIPVSDYATGSITSDAKNIIYDLPAESDADDFIILSKTSYLNTTFGFCVWKNGHNRNFL